MPPASSLVANNCAFFIFHLCGQGMLFIFCRQKIPFILCRQKIPFILCRQGMPCLYLNHLLMKIKTAANFLMIGAAISAINQIGYLSMFLNSISTTGFDSGNIPYLFFNLMGFVLPISLFCLGWALASHTPENGDDRFFNL